MKSSCILSWSGAKSMLAIGILLLFRESGAGGSCMEPRHPSPWEVMLLSLAFILIGLWFNRRNSKNSVT
jgi:hypothetical protein